MVTNFDQQRFLCVYGPFEVIGTAVAGSGYITIDVEVKLYHGCLPQQFHLYG
jgi:hypothetical protein